MQQESFLQRAAQLETPTDLPTAVAQLRVLKAIVAHLEDQLQDALGVRSSLGDPALDRIEARKLLNDAYAAQRALGELNHAPGVLGREPGHGHPFPEALAAANRRVVDTDEAFMSKFFPAPEIDLSAAPAETIPVPAALLEAVRATGMDAKSATRAVQAVLHTQALLK